MTAVVSVFRSHYDMVPKSISQVPFGGAADVNFVILCVGDLVNFGIFEVFLWHLFFLFSQLFLVFNIVESLSIFLTASF